MTSSESKIAANGKEYKDISEVPEEFKPGTQKISNEVSELNPGFKFRLTMTIIFFILAVVFIYWLLKMF